MHRDYFTPICSFTCLHSRDQNDPGTVYNILHALFLSLFHLNFLALCFRLISLSSLGGILYAECLVVGGFWIRGISVIWSIIPIIH
jgi:hypothetical protein